MLRKLSQPALVLVLLLMHLMLRCLVDVCRLVSAEAERLGAAPPSADELMPLLSYVLLRAQVAALPAELAMLGELATESQMMGEQGYCLASFQVGVLRGRRGVGRGAWAWSVEHVGHCIGAC